jgi:hypothetical protein
MAEQDQENREFGPTYKSLFLGACIVIGSAFGWWFTNFISTVDLLTARVAALEVRDTESKWTFRINSEKLNSHDERIRILERDHEQYNRDTRKR